MLNYFTVPNHHALLSAAGGFSERDGVKTVLMHQFQS